MRIALLQAPPRRPWRQRLVAGTHGRATEIVRDDDPSMIGPPVAAIERTLSESKTTLERIAAAARVRDNGWPEITQRYRELYRQAT